MEYQILVLDLDGTLTNSRKEITPETREALIEIQSGERKSCLPAGAPPGRHAPGTAAAPGGLRQLHPLLQRRPHHGLPQRGGHYSRYLPDDALKTVYDLASRLRAEGADLLTYSDTRIISGLKPNRYTMLESSINHMPVLQSRDFLADIPGKVNKFLGTGEPAVIARMKDVMADAFRSYLNIYCSDPFFLEIMPSRIDKAHSLLKLLGSIGLSAEQMICCGDGYNDITMIETAGLGVAMANAQPPVLDSADYITKSNDENGVLHVINKFMR